MTDDGLQSERSMNALKAMPLLFGFVVSACASTPPQERLAVIGAVPAAEMPPERDKADIYASTYRPTPADAFVIRNANILDGAGGEILGGVVLVENGRISAVGPSIDVPGDAKEIDANGAWLTPGVIDPHSHLGNSPRPRAKGNADHNDRVAPSTADQWAENAVWPMDPGFDAARAGGVTTLHVVPGSSNLFAGRGVTLRNVPAISVTGMKFPSAPQSLKMACGENPKRNHAQRGVATRMGVISNMRKKWAAAKQYAALSSAEREKRRDDELDTLAAVITGEMPVFVHCYRADDMLNVMRVASEFGVRITAFHHASEAYKITAELRESGTCAAMWADWYGFKMEAYDSIRENLPMVHAAGGCAMIHSDSALGIQRLNQEVAKALSDGRRAGLEISRADAWKWLSLNPAKTLRIDDQTGSIEPGKRADLVLWSADPFSSYARADKVFIDGALVFDSAEPTSRSNSDFMIGQPSIRERDY